MKLSDNDFLPAILHGLTWDGGHQSPCLILRTGRPETELVFDINSPEAAHILHYLDHPFPSNSSHDIIIRLLVKNEYFVEGLFLSSRTGQETECRLVFRRRETQESWPISLADGIALSLRMSFPLFIHRSLFPLHANPLGNGVRPDVLC